MKNSREEFLRLTTLASFQGVSISPDDDFKVWSHSREWYVQFGTLTVGDSILPDFELYYRARGAGDEDVKRFNLGSRVDDFFRTKYLKSCLISVSDGGHVAVSTQSEGYIHVFWINNDDELDYMVVLFFPPNSYLGSGLAMVSNQMTPDDQNGLFTSNLPSIAHQLKKPDVTMVVVYKEYTYDVGPINPLGSFRIYGEEDSFGSLLGFSPDGSLLAIAAPLEGRIYIYEEIGSNEWQLLFEQVYGNVPGLQGVYLALPTSDDFPTVVTRWGDGQFSILVSLLFWRTKRAMIFKF